jgi:predicted nucleic acid-binding protein
LPVRIAFDTNVLTYGEGFERTPTDAIKVIEAQALLRKTALSGDEVVVAQQVLFELYHVLTKKAKVSRAIAAYRIERLRGLLNVTVNTDLTLDCAFELAVDHQLQIYDAIILAGAAEARCDILYSEDMHAGFTWRGVEVVNPFAA